MQWRCIGPFRGGRSTTVCGVIQDPLTYYFGSVGGGLWKTTDGGKRWRNITDGQINTGSVGAVAVAPSDPNVIYLGMGESPIRGVMTSSGDGVYKSTDAGHTWRHIGLDSSYQIAQIRVHPDNPDLVYVAVQGNPYGPNKQRGIYRSADGGAHWERVHFVDENSGACDLSLDVNNPRVLYAAFWDHTRYPWKMRSGGEGSGIWKSMDGGTSWSELTAGLPDSIMGKIGVAVSPANSDRVYAIIESEQGGLYRSDNAGRSWQLINEDRVLRARSWYYMHIFADPQEVNTVHVLNAPYMRSTDGGRTFRRILTPHGDNHALWIHPDDNDIMINGNDGGANVSYDRGRTWSTQMNQPTAQFYRVNADNRFPYHVYGGQQDNSTVCIPSRSQRRGIENREFYPVGGCESAFCAFDPDDPRFVYATCIVGVITEYDTRTEASKDIMVYPDIGLGQDPRTLRYRFNWNAPVHVSLHDPGVIYHAGNKVLRSRDRGLSWQEISPDLTRNTPEKIDWGGGPITNEGAGAETYHTIMYLAESPHDARVLWTGADDGMIHVTRDGGATWNDVTPPGLPEGIANCIDVSPHHPGTAFVAFTRYKFSDFTPYVYVTTDYGKTWTLRADGIGPQAHVRCVREDTEVPGLLYAGTECGMYVSFDTGQSWHPFQLNLPVVPITDIKVHHGDLVISTQGRAFWILDDLTPVRQWSAYQSADFAALPPRDAYLWGGPRIDTLPDAGANPDYGMVIYYHSAQPDSAVAITISDADGRVIRAFASDAEESGRKIKTTDGLNKHIWNLRRENLEAVSGVMTLGGTSGTRIGPGAYRVDIRSGSTDFSYTVQVKDDPRDPKPADAHAEKQALLDQLHNASQEVFDAVKNIRYVQEQIRSFQTRPEIASDTTLVQQGNTIIATLDSLQNTMVQVKQQTFQDVINFPNQLDGELANIQGLIDGSYPPVTMGQKEYAQNALNKWTEKRAFLQHYINSDLKAYNDLVQERAIPFIAPTAPGVAKRKAGKS
ncbi:MAG: glycosyl hydrolase [Saprospiraceae bacterium]|nr:glycosyl hydrolase [Saprospiraceae bacterium]